MPWIDNYGDTSSPSNPCYTQDVITTERTVTNSSTAGNSCTVTIPAVSGKTAMVDGLLVSGTPLPATVISSAITSSGLLDTFSQNVSLGVGEGNPAIIPLNAIVGSAPNTAVSFTIGGMALVALTVTALYRYQ